MDEPVAQLLEAAKSCLRSGRGAEAFALVDRAILAEPRNPAPLRLRGEILLLAGRPGEAAASFQAALGLHAGDTDALNSLGVALRQLGRSLQAEQAFRAAIALNAGYAEAYSNLGNALQDLGRFEEAAQSYGRALSINPAMAEAHNNLGEALKQLGRVDDALECYRRALSLNPDHAPAYNNLGLAMLLRGAWSAAIVHLQRAIALQPRFVEAHSNLGYALGMLGRYAESERHLRHALSLNPQAAELHNNLGNVLERLDRPAESEQSYRTAARLRANYADPLQNLGLLLERGGRLDEAAVQYRAALDLKPDYTEALASGAFLRQRLCDWSELDADARRLRETLLRPSAGSVPPFILLSMAGMTLAEQQACAQRYAQKELGELLARPPLHASVRRRDRSRLRIGYLSADFYEHATSYLLVDVLQQHDRGRFEIVGYSYSKNDDGATTRRIRSAFDVLRDVGPLPDDATARQIVDDGIDILVDLKGYTRDTRMRITALRPAPIQVNWLGYPGTLGHPRLADYLIGDSIVTPLADAPYYSEALALMPHCYQPNDRRRMVGESPSRSEVGLPAGAFVFCSFNQSYKFSPAMLTLWCRLLQSVPSSCLWLLHPPTVSGAANITREAQARGVDPRRIVFGPHLPQQHHLGRLRLADLALDTFPYTSHTTASDALWVGVPLLTLAGDTFASRVAASVLQAAGMPELITRDPATYLETAIALAADPGRLAGLKHAVAERRDSCPLFDSQRFTRDLEGLYLKMWSDHGAGRRGHIAGPG